MRSETGHCSQSLQHDGAIHLRLIIPGCRDALTMLVSIGASRSMLSFSMFVGIGSKSHVLVVDRRPIRMMSSIVANGTVDEIVQS